MIKMGSEPVQVSYLLGRGQQIHASQIPATNRQVRTSLPRDLPAISVVKPYLDSPRSEISCLSGAVSGSEKPLDLDPDPNLL
jgi:hypothetical protein